MVFGERYLNKKDKRGTGPYTSTLNLGGGIKINLAYRLKSSKKYGIFELKNMEHRRSWTNIEENGKI